MASRQKKSAVAASGKKSLAQRLDSLEQKFDAFLVGFIESRQEMHVMREILNRHESILADHTVSIDLLTTEVLALRSDVQEIKATMVTKADIKEFNNHIETLYGFHHRNETEFASAHAARARMDGRLSRVERAIGLNDI